MNKNRKSLFIYLFMLNFLINGCASIIYKSIPLKDVAKTNGKYFVGTQNFQLVDSTRSMWFTDDIKSFRTLSVKMWYPADENSLSDRAPYVDQYELIAKALSTSLGVPEALMSRAGAVKCNSWLNADISIGNFPIVIYSHGHQSLKIANTFQAEEIASNGYIVIAPDHTYDAALTIINKDKIIYTRSKLPNSDEEAEDSEMIERVKEQLNIRVEDVSFVIDKMIEKFSKDQQFNQSADFENIGIFGHSFGGSTAIMAANNDNRIDAILGLDAYFLPLPNYIIEKDINKPFIHLGQTSWGDSNNYELMKIWGSNNNQNSFHLSVEGSKHNDFTDFSQFTKLTRKFGSGKVPQKIMRNIMNDVILQFFNYHLKSIDTFDANQFENKYERVKTYVH
ncbi:hypothetical protein N9W06_02945 [Candidatus Marinimicrobia bacterium]|nr:hypothetical protein [Candidatus Neomarinimicrobiota bacterium]